VEIRKYSNMTFGLGYGGLTNTPASFCSKVNIQLSSGSNLHLTLKGDVVITMDELDSNPLGSAPLGADAIGWFLEVGVNNPSMFENMTLIVHYNENAVKNAGLEEASLKIYVWDGVKWTALSSKVDTINNTITANVTYLSYFTLGGEMTAFFPIFPSSGMNFITLFMFLGIIAAACIIVIMTLYILKKRRKKVYQKK